MLPANAPIIFAQGASFSAEEDATSSPYTSECGAPPLWEQTVARSEDTGRSQDLVTAEEEEDLRGSHPLPSTPRLPLRDVWCLENLRGAVSSCFSANKETCHCYQSKIFVQLSAVDLFLCFKTRH